MSSIPFVTRIPATVSHETFTDPIEATTEAPAAEESRRGVVLYVAGYLVATVLAPAVAGLALARLF